MTATSRRAASGVVRGAGGEPYDGGVSAAWRATKASQDACSAGVGLRSAGGGDRLGSAARSEKRRLAGVSENWRVGGCRGARCGVGGVRSDDRRGERAFSSRRAFATNLLSLNDSSQSSKEGCGPSCFRGFATALSWCLRFASTHRTSFSPLLSIFWRPSSKSIAALGGAEAGSAPGST